MHIPVMLDECVSALDIKPDGTYADFTLGRAGHAFAVASRLTSGKLFAFDRDADAITASASKLEGLPVALIKSDFRDAAIHLEPASLDGILMDLGVSSPQIDTPARGFSYISEAAIDMRLDQSAPLTAAYIVNTYERGELVRILRDYGEERFAARIVDEIISRRPLETTLQLTEAIKAALPAKALYGQSHHPAMRTFQALRIATNDELGALEAALDTVPSLLKRGGRFVCITFHSLEDRIVKSFITKQTAGCTCPPDFPVCVCHKQPIMKAVTRKPITPSQTELEANPRSHSAKLRVAELL